MRVLSKSWERKICSQCMVHGNFCGVRIVGLAALNGLRTDMWDYERMADLVLTIDFTPSKIDDVLPNLLIPDLFIGSGRLKRAFVLP